MGYPGPLSLAAKGISFSAAPSTAPSEEIAIVSMPGADQQNYNNAVKICLEDTIGFAVVWESDWGDTWFHLWLRNALETHLAGQRLVVLTFGEAAQPAKVGRAQSADFATLQALRIAHPTQEDMHGYIALESAASMHWAKDDAAAVLHTLFADRANPKHTTTYGISCADCAAAFDMTAALEVIVEDGRFDDQQRDLNGETVLELAIRMQHWAAVQILLQAGGSRT